MSTTTHEKNVTDKAHDVNAIKEAKKAKKLAKANKPKGWIRWSGVVGLALLVGLVVGTGYFLGSWGLKKQLEKTASEAWGAQVDIGSIGFEFNPIALEVKGLAITDPDQPMQNLLNIERIHLAINLYHLVVGRVVIDDADIRGLTLNQARKKSGALPLKVAKKKDEKADKKEEETSASMMPSFDLPSADEVLARETLQTVEQGNKVEKELKELDEQWAQAQSKLPTDASLKAYQQELENLFKGPFKDLADIQNRQKRLVELQKQISNDQKAVESAHKLLNDGVKQIRQDLALLQQSPDADMQRLLATYSIDQSGLANITALLFGDKIQQPLTLALEWYNKAQPLIEWVADYRAKQAIKAKEVAANPVRLLGENVTFVEFDPQPTFMIRQLHFSGDLNWGRIVADVKNINVDHQFSRKPVTFIVESQPKSRPAPLVFKGFSSALEGDDVLTRADIIWTDYAVSDWQISANDTLPLNLKQATTNMSGQFNLFGLSRLDSYLDLHYEQVEFDLSASKSTDVKRYIAPAFKDVDQFTVNTRLKGTLTSPGIDIKSDLDRKLSRGFDKVYQQQLAAFKKDLERQLNAKLADVKEPLEKELKRLGVDEGALNQQQKQLQAWLSQDADASAKKAQADLQKQATDEASQRVNEEKKKAEADAKKRVEQELKRFKLPF